MRLFGYLVLLGLLYAWTPTTYGSSTKHGYGSKRKKSSKTTSTNRPRPRSTHTSGRRSSSYSVGPVVVIDSSKYSEGEKLIKGRIPLASRSALSHDEQATRLQRLQDKLPEQASKKINLPAMAGKLTASQMESLEYFLSYRYNVNP